MNLRCSFGFHDYGDKGRCRRCGQKREVIVKGGVGTNAVGEGPVPKPPKVGRHYVPESIGDLLGDAIQHCSQRINDVGCPAPDCSPDCPLRLLGESYLRIRWPHITPDGRVRGGELFGERAGPVPSPPLPQGKKMSEEIEVGDLVIDRVTGVVGRVTEHETRFPGSWRSFFVPTFTDGGQGAWFDDARLRKEGVGEKPAGAPAKDPNAAQSGAERPTDDADSLRADPRPKDHAIAHVDVIVYAEDRDVTRGEIDSLLDDFITSVEAKGLYYGGGIHPAEGGGGCKHCEDGYRNDSDLVEAVQELVDSAGRAVEHLSHLSEHLAKVKKHPASPNTWRSTR